MNNSFQNQGCESDCSCNKAHSLALIVLTGGPGAGKTAILESAKKILCSHVAILPEAASIIFNGGFWRLPSDSAKNAAQRAIFHVQHEMETLVLEENQWGVGLCDRGTLDGLAYWRKSDQSFWDTFHTSKQEEYKRYHAVIHLRTPTTEKGYNHQNPIRIETSEQAVQIDNKIHKIWKDHPQYFLIESTNTFMEKVSIALEKIQSYIPKCCKHA